MVWRRLTRVAARLLLSFWLSRGAKLREPEKGAEQPSMGATETELTATVAEIVHIDDKTSRTIDAHPDHDLFQGLIESTNT